jgi:aminoglycoside phosphotransferase (APT) family kinase protein
MGSGDAMMILNDLTYATQVNFPVPDLLAFTADSDVIGTPFYIMEFVTYVLARVC